MFFGGDPFAHGFPGHGGGGGGRGGRGGGGGGAVDNEEYYKLLGVGKDADENEIKKVYTTNLYENIVTFFQNPAIFPQ